MKQTPERYCNVSNSQLSIARYYGGITVNGAEYKYDKVSDTLVRNDIWQLDEAKIKNMVRQHKEIQRLGRALERAKQEDMF